MTPGGLEGLARQGVVPVIRSAATEQAAHAVSVLRDAGYRIFEITLTTPGALELIAGLAAERDVVVGAGTVSDAADAAACIEAGARFVVSPFLLQELPDLCHERGVACVVGALTPSEIHLAHRSGADAVKVFPAQSVGGPAYLRAVRAVSPHIRLVPTGGVTLDNLTAYLDAGAHFVGVGGALLSGPPEGTADRAARYLERVQTYRRGTPPSVSPAAGPGNDP